MPACLQRFFTYGCKQGASSRCLLGCSFCVCLERGSVFRRDPNKRLGKRRLVSIHGVGGGLGEFGCFNLAQLAFIPHD